MNQEITISRNIISYLSENLPAFEINNAQRVIERLKENFFTVDANREHFKILWLESKKIKNENVMRYIQKLIEHWFTQKMTIIPISFDSEVGLAMYSKDKILFIPDCKTRQIDKLRINNNELEVHNEASFILPETYNKLKHSDSKLRFEQEVIYDLVEIFTPYLRKTRRITVEDPYLPNPKALFNLKLLLNGFTGAEIVLKTHSKHNYCKHNKDNESNFNKLEEFIKELKQNENQAKHEFYTMKKHEERFIITDEVKITLPGGLDFIDKDGKISSNEESVEVVVSKHECQE